MVNLTGIKGGESKGNTGFETPRSIPFLISDAKLPKKSRVPTPSQEPPQKSIQFGPVFKEPFPAVLSTTLRDEEPNIETFCFPNMKYYSRDASIRKKWNLFLDIDVDPHPFGLAVPNVIARITEQIKFEDLQEKTLTMANQFPVAFDGSDLTNIGYFFCCARYLTACAPHKSSQHLPSLLNLSVEGGIEDQSQHEQNFRDSVGHTLDELFSTIEIQWSVAEERKQPETLALLFAIAIERYHYSGQRHDFLKLVEVYNEFTDPMGRQSFLEQLDPNRIHPCFFTSEPETSTDMFMNIAVLEEVYKDQTILNDFRLNKFARKDSQGDFVLRSERFTMVNIDRAWYEAVKETHSKLYNKVIKSIRQEPERHEHMRKPDRFESIFSKLLNPNISEEFKPFTHYSELNFEKCKDHQFKIRNYFNTILKMNNGRMLEKHEQRKVLEWYGDLGAPNPLRSKKKQNETSPKNTVEAIERILTHQGIYPRTLTTNRLISFLDMLWLNFHRQESFGKRFKSMNLLEDLNTLERVPRRETELAKVMFHHSQIVLKLRDKPGEDVFSRTNKFSRNNMYARFLHQLGDLCSNPNKSIDVLARPSRISKLRRLLHPIRLQTGKDLDIESDEDFPFGAVLQIATNRMGVLVDSFIEIHKEYSRNQYSSKSLLKERDAVDGLFRVIASMMVLELCQLHFMSEHLPLNPKKSEYYFNATRLTVSHIPSFESIKNDFFEGQDIHWDKNAPSFLSHLEQNKVKTPRQLAQRISKYCFLGNQEREIKDFEPKLVTQFVSKVLLYFEPSNEEISYSEVASMFDDIYSKMSPVFFEQDQLELVIGKPE